MPQKSSDFQFGKWFRKLDSNPLQKWCQNVDFVRRFRVQWLSMVWDKIPMIWDIIDLANYSLDWHDDLTKSEHHGNSNVADTKN